MINSAAHIWWDCLPTAKRNEWCQYRRHSNGDITIIAPIGDFGPPPGPGNWKFYGFVDERATWGIKHEK